MSPLLSLGPRGTRRRSVGGLLDVVALAARASSWGGCQ